MSTLIVDTLTGKSTATTITIGSTPVVSASANSMTIRGEGSAQTSIQQGLSKAFVNFTSVTTTATRDSFNISSLTDVSTGKTQPISFTSNIAPKLLSRMHNAWKQGDILTAQEINKKLMPLHDALFYETSPGPLKYAASLLGLFSSEARLPIVDIEEVSKTNVKDALGKAGLL